MRELLDRLIKEMVNRGIDYHDAQKEFERRFIAEVLSQSDHNVTRAADKLRMHRNTLSRKVANTRRTKRP